MVKIEAGLSFVSVLFEYPYSNQLESDIMKSALEYEDKRVKVRKVATLVCNNYKSYI